MKQSSFFKINWQHQYNHGGRLRNQRKGRQRRPLSCKAPLHIVFKINSATLRQLSLRSPQTNRVVQSVIIRYSKQFFIKLEQISIQNDHIHLLIRTSKRSLFHNFFRVSAGQIAQSLQKAGLLHPKHVTDTHKTALLNRRQSPKLWKYRPFSRVVKGLKAYKIIRNYIQLNEKEVRGEIKYNKLRLKGLSSSDWQALWI